MSHFTVLVIGNDPEKQLQPYHEYECTGIKDEHVVFVEDEGYDFDPKLGKRGHWTNPNAKWDWYSLGGRWAGFFTVKKDAEIAIQGHHRAKDFAQFTKEIVKDLPPIKVDQCLKGDIDIERMRLEERADALDSFAKFKNAVGDSELPPVWDEFRERFANIDDARNAYGQIEAVQKLRKAGFWEWDEYLVGEEKYIENRVKNFITTFAVVKDGKWYERGKMGWFACVSDEKDKAEWLSEFSGMFDSLPDDTLLSVYDCHI